MTKTTTKSFLQRALDKLTGGDEAKIARFQKKVVKFATSNVAVRKQEIEDIEEKLADLGEKYEETLLDVNLEAIKTSEGLESYVESYTRKVFAVKDSMDDLTAVIAEKRAEIAKFEALAADLA